MQRTNVKSLLSPSSGNNWKREPEVPDINPETCEVLIVVSFVQYSQLVAWYTVKGFLHGQQRVVT